MPGPSPTALFASSLNKADISYIITGAVASIIYGEPRLTHDLDLVVMMRVTVIDWSAFIMRSPKRNCMLSAVFTSKKSNMSARLS